MCTAHTDFHRSNLSVPKPSEEPSELVHTNTAKIHCLTLNHALIPSLSDGLRHRPILHWVMPHTVLSSYDGEGVITTCTGSTARCSCMPLQYNVCSLKVSGVSVPCRVEWSCPCKEDFCYVTSRFRRSQRFLKKCMHVTTSKSKHSVLLNVS